MTPEDWKVVENTLRYSFSGVDLDCDGYQLNLRVETYKPLRQTIMTYINGQFRGIWLGSDCEERRRFFRPVKLRERKRMVALRKAINRARRALGEKPEPEPSLIVYYADWTSFAPLKAHLRRNNKSITLVNVNGQPYAAQI